MSKPSEPQSAPSPEKAPEHVPGFRCGAVAVIGRPNVGKSTLVNALVGERVTITSRKPQTTRHRIRGILTTADAQYIFVDTPGFQTRHRNALNRMMNRGVRLALVARNGRHLQAVARTCTRPASTRTSARPSASRRARPKLTSS